ncbi:hypothetical protein ACQKH5_01045 [Hyphomonas sp. NPDC076900]|uniref:hypothetical protein n=1 Tax=unclassified Hyphomonas TaxID=2630699 RepID=UPI003D00B980
MNAAKKPHDQEPETPAANPASETAEAPARTDHHSPVHVLHSRIEAAFTPQNESRLTRILTMLLVVALSTWLAAQVIQGWA